MSVGKARALRRAETRAERLLWSRLRDRRLGGHKFRRQHPIGPYVVDFLYTEKWLAVEVDGGQHAARGASDQARTLWLESREFAWSGSGTTRSWRTRTAFAAASSKYCGTKAPPHPGPLPQGGEGDSARLASRHMQAASAFSVLPLAPTGGEGRGEGEHISFKP